MFYKCFINAVFMPNRLHVSMFPQGLYAIAPKFLHGQVEKLIKSTNSSLFQRRSVRELLWGYMDPMLKSSIGMFAPVSSRHFTHEQVNEQNWI